MLPADNKQHLALYYGTISYIRKKCEEKSEGKIRAAFPQIPDKKPIHITIPDQLRFYTMYPKRRVGGFAFRDWTPCRAKGFGFGSRHSRRKCRR